MASPQTLQPVLKMKVDELFLFWLSEPSTQAMLKDYLNKIKNGEEIDLSLIDFKSTSTLVLTENNNIASKINGTDRMTATLGAPCSPPSASLPSASGSNNRAGGNARALRRSVSTKKVKHLCSAVSSQCSMTLDLSPCRPVVPRASQSKDICILPIFIRGTVSNPSVPHITNTNISLFYFSNTVVSISCGKTHLPNTFLHSLTKKPLI